MPLPSALFEIRKRSPRNFYSANTPTSISSTLFNCDRGAVFQESATAMVAELADGTQAFLGFVTRPVLQGGPTLGDSIYPGRIELPTAAGDEASFEDAELFEAEGSASTANGTVPATGYLYSAGGSQDILSSTPLKTLCSFKNGLICVALTGQIAEYMIVEGPLTPMVPGNLRFAFQKLHGAVNH